MCVAAKTAVIFQYILSCFRLIVDCRLFDVSCDKNQQSKGGKHQVLKYLHNAHP